MSIPSKFPDKDNVIEGDITKIEGNFAIAHILSNKGVYNAGVAKAIASKWGNAKTYYMARVPQTKLGDIQAVPVELPSTHNRYGYVVNMIAQFDYGRSGRDYIDYGALEEVAWRLSRWYRFAINRSVPIYLPYGMGAGLAGGRWDVIKPTFDSAVPDVTWVKLP